MLLTTQEIQKLHRKYAPNDAVFDLVYTHCVVVNEIAQWCAGNTSKSVNKVVLRNACLLHDIGVYAFFDASGEVLNHPLYPQHAILGAKILADEGLDKRTWHAVETHLLLGLSKEEIRGEQSSRRWLLPDRDYLPGSHEAEILCYADRFHSKVPQFNAYEAILKFLEDNLPLQVKKFEMAAKHCGVPDLLALAAKYQQPFSADLHAVYKNQPLS